MQQERNKVLSNRDKSLAYADTLSEMSMITRAAAEPYVPGDSVKAQIGRAARALGLNYRRARSFWNAEPTAAVRAQEADALRRWYRQHAEQEAERLERRAADLRARSKMLGARLNEMETDAARFLAARYPDADAGGLRHG